MKIMLIDPNFPGVHGYEVVFPFGYACLGGVLQSEGHQVEYVFPTANRLNIEDVVNRISNSDVGLIGLGGLLPCLPTVIDIISMAKIVRRDIPIVVGGPMVTYTPELVLRKTGADFCIAGEGEIALLKLVNSLENNKVCADIPGLVFQREGKIINNGMAEIMPLADIPMPSWDDFPMDYYMYAGSRPPPWSNQGTSRAFTWLLSRGCPAKCNFCASGCKPRYKTIAQSLTELREIVDRFKPDYITFVDNLFTRNKEHTIELCESFMSSGFSFKFSVTSRADLVDTQLLTIMKKAGCQAIFYGLECANNHILRSIKKGITVEQMIEAIEVTKEAGIYPMVSIMFGQPGENFNDFFNSLRIALMSTNSGDPVPNIASIMPLLTFPGTDIYNYAQEHGYFTNDEDYLRRYGDNYQIHYNANSYTNDAVGQAVDIAATISRWKYHQSMANLLLDDIRSLRLSSRVTERALPYSDQQQLREFLNRCLCDLLGYPP